MKAKEKSEAKKILEKIVRPVSSPVMLPWFQWTVFESSAKVSIESFKFLKNEWKGIWASPPVYQM